MATFHKHAVLRSCVLAAGIAMALALGGCGGGGSSNVRPPTPPDNPPPPTDDNEPQPAIDVHLVLTHANQAHDAGFTGKGVTIGFVDSGINRDHPALKGRVVDSMIYLDPAENDLNTDDVVGHGTWVAQIAAGQALGQWPGGIAPDADLVSARIIADEPPKDDGSGMGNEIEASDAAFFADTLHPDLIAAGVQVMNNSWGGLYFNPDHPADVAAAFADAYRPFVIDHDGLVVFAAGNGDADGNGLPDPTDTASLPFWAPDLEQGWIVAVALDSLDPTQLDEYSNACGRSMDYCLAAPGDVVVTAADETSSTPTDFWIVQGTSFAAPQVSGAAALVWEAFPYFDNDLVRQTLLGTADDLGAAGVDKVFGWGLLNAGKAVQGPGTFAWGDVSVDFDSITSTWSNDISGDGGLIKNGTGTLVLAGDNSYSGGTTVNGGSLQATFALPGDVSVGSGGRLDGIAGIKGNLDNAGNVAVHGADTSVGGDYHQLDSGTLSISLGTALKVDGKATVDGGILKVTGAEDGYVANTHTDVLTAAGGVSGTFDSLVKGSGVVFTATTINYDANDVWLDTTGLNVTVAAQGEGVYYTPASMSSAERVQGAFEQLNSRIAAGNITSVSGDFVRSAGAFQQSPNLRAAQASLESLSGQLHAASAAMTLHTIDATGRALADRFDSLLDNGIEQGMWTQNLNLGGDMTRSGFNRVGYRVDGWLVGSDMRVGHHGVAGFALSQSNGTEQLSGRFDRNRSRNTAGMLYAGWVDGHWYARGRAGFGHYHQSINRQLLLGRSYQGVWTDYSGHYNVAYGESGLRFGYGDTRLTPFVAIEYARVAREGFAEQGAGGFGLKADAQTVSRWQSGLGLRATHHWDLSRGRALDLSARVEWRHTLAASGNVFDASFVGIDQWQPLTGIGLSQHSAVFGLGLNAHLSDHTALKFGYDYLTGDRGQAGMLSAKYTMAF